MIWVCVSTTESVHGARGAVAVAVAVAVAEEGMAATAATPMGSPGRWETPALSTR